MSQTNEPIDLNTFAGGQLRELFQQSFQNIIENINDYNCSGKEKREINIKVAFAPDEMRNQSGITVSVKEKLASRAPVKTILYMGKDLSTGRILYEEAGNGLRGQMALSDYAPMEQTGKEEEKKIVKYQKEA